MVNQLGHEATSCDAGDRALALAAELKPDVALIDLMMPGMDGYEVARQIKAACGDEVRLLAVTGLPPDQWHCERAFERYLLKPVLTRDLQDALRAVGNHTAR